MSAAHFTLAPIFADGANGRPLTQARWRASGRRARASRANVGTLVALVGGAADRP